MSISSGSQPEYNAFYDQHSVSDGGSVDSFVVRGAKKAPPQKLKGEKKAKPPPTSKHPPTNERASDSQFSAIFAPFEGCCFSRPSMPSSPHDPIAANQLNSAFSQFILQTSVISDSNNSDTSSEGADKEKNKKNGHIPIGAAAHIFRQTSSSSPNRRILTSPFSSTSSRSSVQSLLLSKGLALSDLPSTTELDSLSLWSSHLPLHTSLDDAVFDLSEGQRCLAALHWCAMMEMNDKMNERLILKLLVSGRGQTGDMSVQHAIQKQELFSTLECSRVIEARLIQEVMGDLQSAVDLIDEGGGNVYLIVSKVRTMGVFCRKQGEVLVISVFDLMISRDRGPGFLGFESISAVESFLISLYESDPRVQAAGGQRFSAWTVKSKYGGKKEGKEEEEGRRRKKGLEPPATLLPPATSAEEEEEGTSAGEFKDPQHGAQLAYTAMYNATAKPGHEERIFSQSPAGALQVLEGPKTQKKG